MKCNRFLLIIILSVLITLFILVVDVIKYPETYFTTWKYQLQEDIKSGDIEAIEYYQEHYISKGRNLFNEWKKI